MQTVLPAVLGAVSGAAGGLLGAVSGAGQQLQQAGSQAFGGLAQGANAAMGSGRGGHAQRLRQRRGTPDAVSRWTLTPTSAAAGAGNPATLNRPPAAAVGERADRCRRRPGRQRQRRPHRPPSAPPPRPRPAAATGTPMGGAMMPAMMPMAGRPGGGAGEDDRRLYPERRMRIETPPNSEPVRGRREARRTRGDKTAEGDDER